MPILFNDCLNFPLRGVHFPSDQHPVAYKTQPKHRPKQK